MQQRSSLSLVGSKSATKFRTMNSQRSSSKKFADNIVSPRIGRQSHAQGLNEYGLKSKFPNQEPLSGQ